MNKQFAPKNKKLIHIVIVLAIIGIACSCLLISPAPFGIDYACFYTTGTMVSDGQIAQIYDLRAHHAALEHLLGTVDYFLEWVYPPSFLIAVVPFSFLPYPVSLALWLLITFLPAGFAAYVLSGRNRTAPLLFLAFPGSFLNIRWGQNGFLSAALLGFGVYFAESNPLLAGLMFGFLTYKPQLAIIPFLILLLMRKWKTFGWSAVFAAALAALSGFLFGAQTWMDFFTSSLYNASILGQATEGATWGIPTLTVLLRSFGLQGWLLNAVLILTAALSVLGCVRVWMQTQRVSLRLLSMALCVFLSLPYVSLYDFAIFGIPVVMLLLEKQKQPLESFHPLALAALWILPLLGLIVYQITGLQLCPLVLAGFLFALVKMTARQTSEIPALNNA